MAAAVLPCVVVPLAYVTRPDATVSGLARAVDGGRIRVVATTMEIADLASAVGGSHVELYRVVRANADPHEVELSTLDMSKLGLADVVIRSGVGLDAWLDAAIRASGTRARVVDASAAAAIVGEDPHWWFDPRNVIAASRSVEEAFTAVDPTRANDYTSAGLAYRQQLVALDDELAAQFGSLTDRRLVTNHDAFGYLVRRYGLQSLGAVLPSFDSQTDLSGARLERLAATLRAARVRAVFAESALPTRAVETLGREAGVRVVEGDGALYGDSLGPPGSGADTYLTMMRHNARVITDNLGSPR